MNYSTAGSWHPSLPTKSSRYVGLKLVGESLLPLSWKGEHVGMGGGGEHKDSFNGKAVSEQSTQGLEMLVKRKVSATQGWGKRYSSSNVSSQTKKIKYKRFLYTKKMFVEQCAEIRKTVVTK